MAQSEDAEQDGGDQEETAWRTGGSGEKAEKRRERWQAAG